jgi:hypothetical protein
MFQAMMATETNGPLPLKVQFALAEPREYREIAVDKMVYSLELGSELAALWPPPSPRSSTSNSPGCLAASWPPSAARPSSNPSWTARSTAAPPP